MKPREKEDLTEAISEGISQFVGDFASAMLKGLVIAVVILFIIATVYTQLVAPYLDEREYRLCEEDPDCSMPVPLAVQGISNCPFDELRCYIYFGDDYFKKENSRFFYSCGYSEAEVKYEYLKNHLENKDWFKENNFYIKKWECKE